MGTELGHGLFRARQSHLPTKTDLQKVAKGAKLDALTLANFAPFCSKLLVPKKSAAKVHCALVPHFPLLVESEWKVLGDFGGQIEWISREIFKTPPPMTFN